ncbi:MAG: hypothetical protein CMC84_01210 [Flavobacteriaceae bacterium]|nr:hypothetical protein [Flavobacteriaceae bacterium]|tara:strand:+ start:1361 stop:1549 length:189 start_codon:yes stop_codon:yes gene_type:complete
MKSEVLSIMRERDFFNAKVEEQKKYIRKLEYDNAELVKKDKEMNTRLKELSTFRKPRRFNRG